MRLSSQAHSSLFVFSLLLIVNLNDWHLAGMVDPIGTSLGAASLAIQLLDGAVKGWYSNSRLPTSQPLARKAQTN